MFHPPFTLKPDIWMLIYEIAIRGNKSTEAQILFDNISHFNLYGNPSPTELANKINHFQEIASRSRLGVPITISSDPIHEVPKGGGVASFSVDGFSKWPSQLGFAATNNSLIIENFAQEYDIGFFLKRARVAEQIFGSSKFHTERYANLSGF